MINIMQTEILNAAVLMPPGSKKLAGDDEQ
jgi:hypothetical protein